MGSASKFLMLLSTPFSLLYPRPSALRLARHSRVSLTSLSTASSAAQNRISSSDSCPRHGFSVGAAKQIHPQTSIREDYGESFCSLPNSSVSSHPWTEWLKLVEHVTAGGYADRQFYVSSGDNDDSFSVSKELPEEFVKAAGACLLFARDRPDILRLLSKKDIEVVVENGSPFLFKNALNSTRRMKLFLGGDGSDVLESERAHTVDVMRYLLSYACNPLAATGENDPRSRELVEASVRRLLSEMVKISGTVQESNATDSIPGHAPFRYEHPSRPPGQNIEMKRGDWICPKCSFMNFARNMKCLECDEGRPKRQLTGAEWECPQCEFFNYGRNLNCLKCDCKRPGEIPSGTAAPGSNFGYGGKRVEQIFSAGTTDESEIDRRLVENDVKAERWFSKVSQLDDSSDLSSAVADEDFPEIMPLRKGVNRFVVSTRKTPLERRLANAQYRRNSGNDGSVEGNDSLSGNMVGTGSDGTSESAIGRSLDRILGRPSATSGTNHLVAGETSARTGSRLNSPEGRDSGFVPFVPLPADMFSKEPNTDQKQLSDKEDSASVKANQMIDSLSGGSGIGKSGDGLLSEVSENLTESRSKKESSDSSERWSRKVAEPHIVTDLASAKSDEDFPEIMPMRKGENRFVVSKKKDRSLTSPQYKRRLAMEQANNSNFVPFVPFPPDYFAKKDNQPEAGSSTGKAADETSASTASGNVSGVPEKLEGNKVGGSDGGFTGNVGRTENPRTNRESWKEISGHNLNDNKVDAVHMDGPTSAQQPNNLWNNNKGSLNSGFSRDGASASGISTQRAENPQNTRENWNRGLSGKSLEGSAVTEPDPLDMSEEAKAQRWFRRVAQINDISELSKIPDEDFPEIMPMRKGVNRFVVSKRKTPLERRLTSPQYRRNLPIVSSDPKKDAS